MGRGVAAAAAGMLDAVFGGGIGGGGGAGGRGAGEVGRAERRAHLFSRHLRLRLRHGAHVARIAQLGRVASLQRSQLRRHRHRRLATARTIVHTTTTTAATLTRRGGGSSGTRGRSDLALHRVAAVEQQGLAVARLGGGAHQSGDPRLQALDLRRDRGRVGVGWSRVGVRLGSGLGLGLGVGQRSGLGSSTRSEG